MLTIFFALIFIAELVLVCELIRFIVRLDKKVCELTSIIDSKRPVLNDKLISVRIAVNSASLSINKLQIKIAEKKNKYKYVFIKHLITLLLFLILNTNGKKIFTAVDLLFSAKAFVKAWYKKFA